MNSHGVIKLELRFASLTAAQKVEARRLRARLQKLAGEHRTHRLEDNTGAKTAVLQIVTDQSRSVVRAINSALSDHEEGYVDYSLSLRKRDLANIHVRQLEWESGFPVQTLVDGGITTILRLIELSPRELADRFPFGQIRIAQIDGALGLQGLFLAPIPQP